MKKKFKLKWYVIVIIIVAALIAGAVCTVFLSPKVYLINTAKWTEWNETDKQNVTAAMGEENTEENFRLYFQYYNVVHELGHGLIIYNKGVNVPIADEEQLVNDFAVAYWNYYGEHEKMKQLSDIVTHAVENVGDNYKNGVDYLENAKQHSNERTFDSDFFNFNDYGWFQFSSVKHSIEQNKSLEDVLKEMGFKDFKLSKKTVLRHNMTDEKESTAVVNEAVENFRAWGLEFPHAHQSFTSDPNMNTSRPFINLFGMYDD